MSVAPLRIGVIAASLQQLSELNRLIRAAGQPVAASVTLRPDSLPSLPPVDLWVVNLDLDDGHACALIEQLDASGTPVIYEEDLPLAGGADSPVVLRQQKERRLAQKLRQCVREPDGSAVHKADEEPTLPPRARQVWVLAASTGGPEAVSEFLAGIPADLCGVALLYAQHIDHQALDTLHRVMARHSAWQVQRTDEARLLRERTLYLISPQHQIELHEDGVLSPLAEPWSGRFRPSIDQVIAKVARVYKTQGGAIVFSGMGDDGALSCTLLRHRGGQVWVQSPASCTIDSMPVSVEKAGGAHFSAPPAGLARQFVRWHTDLQATQFRQPPLFSSPMANNATLRQSHE